MLIKEKDLEALEKNNDRLKLSPEYIPSMEDLDIMEENPDKFAAFMLWLGDHHPEPETEEQKKCMKRLKALRNKAIEIE